MRETDSRIAKYSRRGLILNFLVFLLCLAYGDFFSAHQQLALTLVAGLLVVTLLRSYYMFRFDNLYGRAPSRWRNQYFLVSCLGAAWWSVILVSLTWTQGMRDETLVMWLYSIVFYSSVANVFSAYSRFLNLYLFIGQIPAAATALFLGTAEGYLYGVIMLVFYLMLCHQGRITGESYWQRLEANYALNERAKHLEDQKLDSIAAAEFKDTFLVNLGHEFRTSLNNILGSLALLKADKLTEEQTELLDLATRASERQLDFVNNVVDYAKISTNELVLDETDFDLRKLMESVVFDLVSEAEQQGVELHISHSENLPQRVKGDPERLHQLLNHLISHALKFSDHHHMVIRGEYIFKAQSNGRLRISVSDCGHNEDDLGRQLTLNPDDHFDTTCAESGLSLTLCKGLAECLGGELRMVNQTNGAGHDFIVEIQLSESSYRAEPWQLTGRCADTRVLLVNAPEQTASYYLREIASWGAQVNSTSLTNPDETLSHEADTIICFGSSTLNACELAKMISQQPQAENSRLIISGKHNERNCRIHHLPDANCINLPAPFALRALFDALGSSQCAKVETAIAPMGAGQKVLIVEDNRVNQKVAAGMLKKLGYSSEIAANGIEALSKLTENDFELILMDCQMPEMDGFEATREIRLKEQGTNRHTPVVAMTAHVADGDEAKCLAAGMDDYLAKPVRLEDLSARLRRWIGTAQAESE